jgi:hypothetical protein
MLRAIALAPNNVAGIASATKLKHVHNMRFFSIIDSTPKR